MILLQKGTNANAGSKYEKRGARKPLNINTLFSSIWQVGLVFVYIGVFAVES